tara:strand:- start:2309 stop:3019 length:711 start_codon:yes stop_codon:yes gene_type:complete
MCDPVTMTVISSGMSMAGGSSMLAGTSLGTGLINAASMINAGSAWGAGSEGGFFSIGNAMGAVRNISMISSSIMSNPLTSIALSAQQGRYQGEAALAQARGAEIEAKQHRDNAQRAKLQMEIEELDRRQKYLNEVSSVKPMMAKYGYTYDSPSAKALMTKNRENYLLDNTAIRLTGLDQVLESTYAQEQSVLRAKAKTREAQKAPKRAVLGSLLKQSQTFAETAAARLLKGRKDGA